MNRQDSLNRLLRSIYSQSVLPETVIIVDGSDQPTVQGILRHPSVNLLYVREFPPSLTRQRNAGINAIPDGLTHVGFLDDDLEFLPGTLAAMTEFIAGHGPDLGGVSFQIIGSYIPGRFHPVLVAMGHSSFSPGKVCKSGFAVGDLGAQKPFYSEWLCGGATVWRREIFRTFSFDEWFKGYALWEDVDFSYRVSKKYRLAVVPSAKVNHWHFGIDSRARALRVGDLEVVDRFYFVHKHADKMSKFAAIWASVWVIFRNLRIGLMTADSKGVLRAVSNLRALLRCAGGRIERAY